MILSGRRRHSEPVRCRGFLVVGDPHVSSRRPGRRTDAVWPDAILGKLEHCVALANEQDLAPVMLGDLFEHPVEPDEGLKSRLVRILKQFRMRPIVNVGNHDVGHTRLADGDSLALLAACDVVDVAPVSGAADEFLIEGRRIGVGMTPYGQEVPRTVRGMFGDADLVAWFTHHDIAFDGTYPGAVPPFSIEGCTLVVNGHVHATKPSVIAGRTLWTNPGNITRQSIDAADHVPRAWVLSADAALHPQELPHQPDVFDHTGRLVRPAGESEMVRTAESAFVSLLEAESATELLKSDDGSLVREEMEAKFEREGTRDSVRAILRSLLAEAVERRKV